MAWAGRAGGPAATGTVTGPVICDQVTATGAGQRLLAVVAAVIATIALLTLVVLGGPRFVASVLVPLLPGLLVLGLLLLTVGVALFPFRRPRQGSAGRSGHLAVSAAKRLVRFVTAPMRAVPPRAPALTTEVRRFRVTEVSGREVNCELVGEVAGADLRQGDVVDVFGRRTRHGTVRVRVVVVTGNWVRITARPNAGFVVARLANMVAVALSAACVIGVVNLLVNR